MFCSYNSEAYLEYFFPISLYKFPDIEESVYKVNNDVQLSNWRTFKINVYLEITLVLKICIITNAWGLVNDNYVHVIENNSGFVFCEI